MAFIDLVIVTHNHPQLLHELLSSMKYSGIDLTDLAHVTIVNNGHPDSLKGLPENNWYSVVQAPKNLGWEGGVDLGYQHTTAPIVGFLNDDLRILPGSALWLRRLAAWFRDPAVGAVGPSSNYVAGCQSIFWNPTTYVSGLSTWRAPFLIGFCVLLRREAWDRIGGIDLALPGGDDLDWSIRLRQAGYTLVADRSVFVYHHGQQTGVAEHGAFWNSEAMLNPIHTALIRKHGFLNYWRCVAGTPEPYLPPWAGQGVSGSEERLLAAAMPEDGVLLDLGCGSHKVMDRAVGVDVHVNEAVPQLNHEQSQATVEADVGARLPFDPESVSGIIAKHVLEHLPDPLTALTEWHRVLKPGGRLAVAVPDASKINGIAMNPEHRHDFTPGFLTALLGMAGFREVTVADPDNGISFVITATRNGMTP